MAEQSPTALLTRPAGRNSLVGKALLRRGWGVLECPALEIHSVPVAQVVELAPPDNFDLVVFVSRAAVTGYRHQLPEGFVWPAQVKAGCMGPVTATAIQRTFGEQVSVLYPDGAASQDSEALWPLILQHEPLPRRVLILRGQDGREWLSAKLTQLGVDVVVQQTYQREIATWAEAVQQPLQVLAQSGGQAVWLLTSAHGVLAIADKMQALNLMGWYQKTAFVLTHERLGKVLAQSVGLDCAQLRYAVTAPDDAGIVLCFDQIARQLKHS